MTTTQQFCLRWNNHQSNFITVFNNLLTNEALVDVTLAAEGKQLQAHKVVLSACSSYFQALFTSNPCQHPIVILKDIKYSDLKTMVDFMYCGEVNVSQDQLPAILKTAETLKIKGLAETQEQFTYTKSVSQSSDKCDSPMPASPSVLRRKRFRKSSTGSGSEQTSEETGISGGSGSGTELGCITPSPTGVKTEADQDSHHPHLQRLSATPTRRDPSSESEGPRDGTTGSHSFEDDASTPRNVSEDAGDSNIRWSSLEEKASPTIPQPTVSQGSASGEGGNGVGNGGSSSVAQNPMNMGSKQRRLLMRQHRMKKIESEMGGVDESEGAPTLSHSSHHGRIERHSSEPAPNTNLLTVPSHSFSLVKQNSSPHLSSVSTPTITPTPNPSPAQPPPLVPTVHVQAPSPTELSPPVYRVKIEDLRRTVSSPQCGLEPCTEARACHCPVLRPGPALGCNFCWNTVDNHGRILRRKTKYHCPECQTNLCIVPCFQEYHEKQAGSISSSGLTIKEGPSSSGAGSSSSGGTPGAPTPSYPTTIMKPSFSLT